MSRYLFSQAINDHEVLIGQFHFILLHYHTKLWAIYNGSVLREFILMARGKYLSLEEARKLGQIDQFCKEHPSEADGERFERLLDAACKGKPPKSSAKAEET